MGDLHHECKCANLEQMCHVFTSIWTKISEECFHQHLWMNLWMNLCHEKLSKIGKTFEVYGGWKYWETRTFVDSHMILVPQDYIMLPVKTNKSLKKSDLYISFCLLVSSAEMSLVNDINKSDCLPCFWFDALCMLVCLFRDCTWTLWAYLVGGTECVVNTVWRQSSHFR